MNAPDPNEPEAMPMKTRTRITAATVLAALAPLLLGAAVYLGAAAMTRSTVATATMRTSSAR